MYVWSRGRWLVGLVWAISGGCLGCRLSGGGLDMQSSRGARGAKISCCGTILGWWDTFVSTSGHFWGGGTLSFLPRWDIPPHPCFGRDGRNSFSRWTCSMWRSKAPLPSDGSPLRLPPNTRLPAEWLIDELSRKRALSFFGFHPHRFYNCIQDRAYALELDDDAMPQLGCQRLPSPTLADWATLLHGRSLLLIGDSILRDYYFFLVATLHAATTAHATRDTSVRAGQLRHEVNCARCFRSLHPGTSYRGVSNSTISFSVTDDSTATVTSLIFCWYSDRKFCLADRLRDGTSGDVQLILHHGSDRMQAARPWPATREPAGSAEPRLVQATPIVAADGIDHESVSRHRKRAAAAQDRNMLEMVAAAVALGRRRPIWVGYGAPHFPWGAGEFEDDKASQHVAGPADFPVCSCENYKNDQAARCRGHYSQLTALRHQPYACPCGSKRAMAATGLALAPGARPPCTAKACLPLGGCISTHSAARLAMADPYLAVGARLLPMWDVTHSMFHSHLWHSATDTAGGKPAASLPLDCRHWCNPGAVPLAWSRRLFLLLTDEGANLTSCAVSTPSSMTPKRREIRVCDPTAPK